jgi:hypothetical protein
MQKKGHQREPGSNEDLAKVTTLNQEDDKVKKELIILDVGGRAVLQENKDEQNDEAEDGEQPHMYKESSATKDGDSAGAPATPTQQPGQHEPNESEAASPSSQVEHFDSAETKGKSENPHQVMAANNMVSIAPSNHNSEPGSPLDDDHILKFEFALKFIDIRQYMAPLHKAIGDSGKVWFSGKINKNTGKVISSSLGRLSQRQEKQQQD